MEQITYLLFLRRLDDLHTLELNKATRLKNAPTRRIFPEGSDSKGRPYESFRWLRFRHFEAKDLADVPMDDRDTKGDLYEYMLGKIASAGQNGQFRPGATSFA